jgi:hypothetical protein
VCSNFAEFVHSNFSVVVCSSFAEFGFAESRSWEQFRAVAVAGAVSSEQFRGILRWLRYMFMCCVCCVLCCVLCMRVVYVVYAAFYLCCVCCVICMLRYMYICMLRYMYITVLYNRGILFVLYVYNSFI